eukprot:sb/3477488/
MDRTFSSWEHSAPVDEADVSDFKKLEVSIMGTLRLVGGYPDPNKEGGIFEAKRMVHSYLNKLDTTKKTKFIAEMAGLLCHHFSIISQNFLWISVSISPYNGQCFLSG